jgi:hypothetical protein
VGVEGGWRAAGAARWRKRLLAVLAVAVLTSGFIAGKQLSAQSPAVARAPLAQGPDLGPGQALLPGHALVAVNGYRLTLRRDGDLVATEHGRVFWANHVHSPHAEVLLDPAGSLVEYSVYGVPVWSVGARIADACLQPSITDGTFVVPYPHDAAGVSPLWNIASCEEGNPGGAKVAVVGDSITLFSQPDIQWALGASYSYQISGMPGFGVGQQLPAVQGMVDNPQGAPSDFVVELGTNDALNHWGGWRTSYRRLLDMVGERCTVLVNVNVTPADDAHHEALAINRWLAAQVAAHPNLHLLDWNRALNTGNHRAAWLDPTGIHPNAAGSAVLALLYRAALNRFC